MSDVFISYAREDQATAERLRALLDQEGWVTWMDQEIRVGRPWSVEIERALDRVRAVVVLWTTASVGSEWVGKEAAYALAQEKLFGAVLDDCTLAEPFRAVEAAMMHGWRGAADHPELIQLVRALAEAVPPSRIDTVRPGYDSRFLGETHAVGWPSVYGTAQQLHYLHFSVVMNPARRLAWYVAYTTDSTERPRLPPREDRWLPDPLVTEHLQPSNRHFVHSGYDRGHLAPRAGLAWGEERQAAIAARQAFFWTNTAPQHPNLNRGSYLAVELWERDVAVRLGRIVGLCGPVFADTDPRFRDEQEGDDGFIAYGTFQIPQAYWKIVAGVDAHGTLRQRAFLFPNPAPKEPVRPQRRGPETFAVDMATLAEATTLVFPAVLAEAPPLDWHP